MIAEKRVRRREGDGLVHSLIKIALEKEGCTKTRPV